MGSTYFPSGSPRTLDDNQYEIISSVWGTDGLLGAVGDTSAVFGDSTGRQVKFRAGKYAQLHGRGWSSGPTDIIKPVASNSSGQPRIDLAVIGIDRSTWAVTEYIKTGTAAASPVPPALQRDVFGAGTGKWEFPVARIAVASGAATINPSDVTAINSFIGAEPVVVPDVATLAMLPAPAYGQTAIVVDTLYVYTTSGWRRADWNAAWGVIGGGEMTGSGAVTASGIGSTPSTYNISSGAVLLTAGRRYMVYSRYGVTATVTGTTVATVVRENSISGNTRASDTVSGYNAGYRYDPKVIGQWSETTGGSRSFVLVGYCTTGLISVYRTSYDTERAGVFIHDEGPASAIPAPS